MKYTLNHMIKSKRRMLKIVIYAVYMYLFVKRFSFVLKFFKEKIIKAVKSILKGKKILSPTQSEDNSSNLMNRI